MGDGGCAVDDAAEGKGAHGVEAGRREVDAMSDETAEHTARDPDREPDRHLLGKDARTTTQNDPCVSASSIIPIIRAIPTGSFAPDSPSRIVPVRPLISCSPSTENITAGSVGAIAAPRRPAVVQPRPKTTWAKTATSAAVANVPGMPSAAIGPTEPRRRRQPIEEPPSKRITISATVPMSLDRRDRKTQRRPDVRGDRGRHEEDRGGGDRRAGDRLREQQRRREPAGDEQDCQAEAREVVH